MRFVREHPRLASARIARQIIAPASATAIDCIIQYPLGVARKARTPYEQQPHVPSLQQSRLQQQSSLHPFGQQQPSLQHSQQSPDATVGVCVAGLPMNGNMVRTIENSFMMIQSVGPTVA